MGGKNQCESTIMNNTKVINRFIITPGDYTCRLYILQTKIYIFFTAMLLNHLWYCVLKLVSEFLHFI